MSIEKRSPGELKTRIMAEWNFKSSDQRLRMMSALLSGLESRPETEARYSGMYKKIRRDDFIPCLQKIARTTNYTKLRETTNGVLKLLGAETPARPIPATPFAVNRKHFVLV